MDFIKKTSKIMLIIYVNEYSILRGIYQNDDDLIIFLLGVVFEKGVKYMD